MRVDLNRDTIDCGPNVIDSIIENLGNGKVVDSITAAGSDGYYRYIYLCTWIYSRSRQDIHVGLILFTDNSPELVLK
jgi:hypothetical protein